MNQLVRYQVDGPVATITMDDGKLNVLSFEMFAALSAALDRAQAERAVVVLAGREGAFSAGFDLKVLRSGDAMKLVLTGFELAARLFAFPAPVVVASPGHAIAMGSFLLLTGDYRIGAQGPFKIGANEVAIGLIIPHFPVELCRQRLAPTHFHRAVALSEMFTPDDAVTAGFLDRAVPPAELAATGRAVAAKLATLDRDVASVSKLRVRAAGIAALRTALSADTGGAG